MTCLAEGICARCRSNAPGDFDREENRELRHMPKYLIVKIIIEKDKKQLLTRVVGRMPFTIVVNMGIRSLINDNASSILGI